MNTQELRELDKWIDRNLFNRSSELSELADRYTTSQHYAMDVLKKCAEGALKGSSISIRSRFLNGPGWCVEWDEMYSYAETLELAICLFAKQLFSK